MNQHIVNSFQYKSKILGNHQNNCYKTELFAITKYTAFSPLLCIFLFYSCSKSSILSVLAICAAFYSFFHNKLSILRFFQHEKRGEQRLLNPLYLSEILHLLMEPNTFFYFFCYLAIGHLDMFPIVLIQGRSIVININSTFLKYYPHSSM